MMQSTTIVIIGAGQAGLATSHCLAGLGICHVVLERGRVGQRWQTERWDSLRLLTPNWMTRLPGRSYDGDDPDGFMPAREVAELLREYARSFSAPVIERAKVLGIHGEDGRYCVFSTRGVFRCRGVVVATGHCDRPVVPRAAMSLHPSIRQIVPAAYKGPQDLPPGGALVVGASATGVQLAEELHRSGRRVTLAVGRHTRVPRRYRGFDIMRWLDGAGILDEPLPATADVASAHRQTSLQLIGSPEGREVSLATLLALGVRLAGRVADINGTHVHFGPDLQEHTARAEAKLRRLLARVDEHVTCQGLSVPAADEMAPVLTGPGPERLDLAREGIRSIVWATGFRRSYDWLHVPVLNGAGEIEHRGGVTRCAGLYVVGMPFQSRRKSTFIDGVGADAAAIAGHIRWTLLEDRSGARIVADGTANASPGPGLSSRRKARRVDCIQEVALQS
jgi:putative flavoprotein involved in K+ transport